MNPGDRVQLTTKNGVIEGVLMPPQPGVVLVKLDTGYNLGISEKNVTSKKVVKKYVAPKEKKETYKKDSSKKTITILHTGGTIASKVDYQTGAVIARFTPAELLRTFPELRDIANIDSALLSNMWSEDMRFGHYNKLAEAVHSAVKKGSAGVIITHGTDTLHYTAAALSFALQGLKVPVVIVGAQRSSDRPSSDARLNLIGASRYILDEGSKPGVYVGLHAGSDDEEVSILHGCHARKDHSSTRDAFVPVNFGAVATVYRDGKVSHHNYPVVDEHTKFVVRPFNEKIKVGLLKVHPHMYAEEFSAYSKFDGLIIEGTGLGHAPISTIDDLTKSHKKIATTIKNLSKNMPVVMTTQTIAGRVNMNVYSSGRDVQELGVIGNYGTMHSETAFVKLAWLLSNYPIEDVRDAMVENLRGEQLRRLTND